MQIPAVQARREALLADAASMAQPDDVELQRPLSLRMSRRTLEGEAHIAALRQPRLSLRFLQPGRLAHIVDGQTDREASCSASAMSATAF